MKTTIVAVMMLLVMSMGCYAQGQFGISDGVITPSASVVEAGTATLQIEATGNDVYGDRNMAVTTEVGLFDRLSFFARSSLRNTTKRNDISGGVKFVAGPYDGITDGQVTVFLNNIGENRTIVPGVVLTTNRTPFEWLSYNFSGWFVNDNWIGGFSTLADLTENVNIQAEFNTEDRWVYGIGFRYKKTFAELKYLNESDDFFGSVGMNLLNW